MTSYFSYVGRFDDLSYTWEDDGSPTSKTNLPKRLFPKEWWQSAGVSPQYLYRSINDGTLEGRQLDWGAWGVKMTGTQLRAFYADKPHKLHDELAALDPDAFYILVAGEE